MGEDTSFAFPILLISFSALLGLNADRLGRLVWPGRLLAVASYLTLVLGLVPIVLSLYFGASAGAAVWGFHILGVFAYLRMLRARLGQTDHARRLMYVYGSVLVLLSVISWVSAFALASRRGVDLTGRAACVLRPEGGQYSGKFHSVWDMRLASFASFMTQVDNSAPFLFHAVLLAPGAEPSHYSWSKRHLRFEPIEGDPVQQWGLPEACPG